MLEIIAPYWEQTVTLIGLATVALISPGPDFAIVVKNSLVYSRRTGLFTALGIAIAALMHASYTMLGFGVVIAETPWLFGIIKYLGATYLLYIGYKGLKAKKMTLDKFGTHHHQHLADIKAFKLGFITCALNPKAILFFIGVFAIVITNELPMTVMILYAAIIFVETIAWFSFVALCLSTTRTRAKFSAKAHIIERITGVVLITLALKLFFMSF